MVHQALLKRSKGRWLEIGKNSKEILDKIISGEFLTYDKWFEFLTWLNHLSSWTCHKIKVNAGSEYLKIDPNARELDVKSLFPFLGKNFQVSMSMNNVSFIYLILYSIFWQLWSYFVLGQGETQGGWTHILLLVQYSTLLFACSPHLLVGVNVPDARKSNQSKRPARRRCSIWYMWKVHQRLCTHMHTHEHAHWTSNY